MPLELEAQSPNLRTTKEVPAYSSKGLPVVAQWSHLASFSVNSSNVAAELTESVEVLLLPFPSPPPTSVPLHAEAAHPQMGAARFLLHT